MLFDIKTVPTRKELLIDLAAFAATVVFAVVQGWKAADIVWASWITSLLIGLSFFLILSIKKLIDYAHATSPVELNADVDAPRETTEAVGETEAESGAGGSVAQEPMEGNPGCQFLAVGGFMAVLAWFAGPGPVRVALLTLLALDFVALVVSILAPRGWLGLSMRHTVVRAFIFLPTSLFLIFFFLVHFGGFHLGHAVFLNFLVPAQVGFQVAADALAAPFEVPASVHEALLEAREALVAVREACLSFLGLLILTYWPYIVSVAVKSFAAYREALMTKSKGGEEMILPYKNVIRVHLLIFALIPMAAFGSGLVMTIGVMAFFFFPVESVVAWYRSR